MALERLLNLTAALLDTGRALTAAELRERIEDYPDGGEAFHAAFSRDKRVLREMGIPIVRITVEDDDGNPIEAYRIRKDDYYLRDPGLDPDELGALHLAASAVRIDGAQEVEGLWKLGGGETPSVDVGVPEVHLPTDPRLAVLFAASAERRIVRFGYQGERREVEPHRLLTRNARWYLVGFDRVRDAERRFRLDRIDGEVEAGQPRGFERRPELEVSANRAAWEMGDEEPVTALLLVDAEVVTWAATLIGDEAPREERADGSVQFAVRVTNRSAFRTFALGFLDRAEVLAPPDLRVEMVTWLGAIAAGEG